MNRSGCGLSRGSSTARGCRPWVVLRKPGPIRQTHTVDGRCGWYGTALPEISTTVDNIHGCECRGILDCPLNIVGRQPIRRRNRPRRHRFALLETDACASRFWCTPAAVIPNAWATSSTVNAVFTRSLIREAVWVSAVRAAALFSLKPLVSSSCSVGGQRCGLDSKCSYERCAAALTTVHQGVHLTPKRAVYQGLVLIKLCVNAYHVDRDPEAVRPGPARWR